jgi:hypothetical protein
MSNATPSKKSKRAGGGWVCWGLMLMGLATLAPCILLPEWREYQALKVAQQHEEHRLSDIESALEREKRSLVAIQTDPAVVARLARRDLRFHDPAETRVRVQSALGATTSASPFVPQPVNPPAWAAAGERYLPRLNYDGVFCDEETRRIVMGMSLGLLALSMALSPRRECA